jgi:GxxExxY protein
MNVPPERDEQTDLIIGAAIEVHRVLGPGFSEIVYQHALACELARRQISFAREVSLPVTYEGQVLDCQFRLDFICFGEVIVELKALSSLSGTEEAQVINYLKASRHKRALLLNFGSTRLGIKRMVLNYEG